MWTSSNEVPFHVGGACSNESLIVATALPIIACWTRKLEPLPSIPIDRNSQDNAAGGKPRSHRLDLLSSRRHC